MNAAEYLRIGKILGVHGLLGRLKIYMVTDIGERFSQGSGVYIEKDGRYHPYTVKECVVQKGRMALVKLDGVSERGTAESLKGREIFIEKSKALEIKEILGEGEFLYCEIIGCAVYHKGKELGLVEDILEAGSGNILLVKAGEGREYMVPFVNEMVDTSQVAQNRIDIHPVEGLLDI